VTSELAVVPAVACVRVAQRPQLRGRLGGEGVPAQAIEIAIWHNWMIGAPVKRSLTAYDHS
jgi:hypothetical protein